MSNQALQPIADLRALEHFDVMGPAVPERALTRRAIVKAAPVAIAAAAIPAVAVADGAHLDVELLALREPWLATLIDYNTALDLKSKAQSEVFARTEAYPDERTWTGSDVEFCKSCARITAERVAIGAEVGLDEAERLEASTTEAELAIVDRISRTPALTLAGLAFKVEVSEEWAHGREDLLESIMADIRALAKGGLDA